MARHVLNFIVLAYQAVLHCEILHFKLSRTELNWSWSREEEEVSLLLTTTNATWSKRRECIELVRYRKNRYYKLADEKTEGKMIKQRHGKNAFVIEGYTYCRKEALKTIGAGERWQCSSRVTRLCYAQVVIGAKDGKCKLYGSHNHPPPKIITDENGTSTIIYERKLAYIVRTYDGKMLALFKDYSYTKYYTLKKERGTKWACSHTKPDKCEAKVILRQNGSIRKVLNSHIHPPPRYYINQHVLMVKGRHGKDLLMLNGYTYYQHKLLKDGFRWSCTQMGSRSCRGFLHVTNEMLVVRAHTEHTHPPSRYSLKSINPQLEDDRHKRDQDGRQGINPLAFKIASVQGHAGF